MEKRDETRGLHNKGNRVLLGVGVGFVASIFAGLLDAGGGVQIILWLVVAAITYAIATPN